jgi:histidinol-phosphate aminotransferase
MMRLDRRQWLRSLGFALSGLGVSRLLEARPASRATPCADGGELARLSLNENPFGPAPGVAAALERERSNLCRYTGAEFDALVAAIAAREGVPRDQIILGEILEPLGTHLSLQGGPGGEFIYSDPGYTALIDAAVAVGGRAVAVPLNPRLENDLPALAAGVNERTRAMFLVNPHNPTGIVADADELRSFARTVARRALVIVDEAYLEFADHFAQRTLTDLVRGGENVIVFRTFAKVYGLAGLDIGYGLVPRAIARTLSAQGANNPHLFNRLAVAAAAASLRDESYVGRVTREVAEEREQWVRLFRELGLRHTPSSANFVFFEAGVPHAVFSAALLQQGVAIGHVFPPYDRWARMSIGLPAENARARAAVRKSLRPART